MNRAEHLLTCLGEECSEVSIRASKALRFGLSEVQPGQKMTNAQRITAELKDVWAAAIICAQAGLIPFPQPSISEIEAKRAKIEKFMAISREQGVLSDA
ncbi:MAG TPA: hypothetical protein VGO55_03105 [Allosphingosinicella sp.]|jgi:hypothetical protein|nr:hypothetical protein [Allosphingosinicella sp.]